MRDPTVVIGKENDGSATSQDIASRRIAANKGGYATAGDRSSSAQGITTSLLCLQDIASRLPP